MRKIQTKEQLEKKKKRNQYILGLTMIFLLAASTAGFSLMSREETTRGDLVSEGGIEFVRASGLWSLSVGEQIFYFQYLPSEIEEIKTNITLNLGDLSARPLYFVNVNSGVSEIITNIGPYIQRYQEACLPNQNCTENLPVKNCSDSNIIVFETANKTSVNQIENCIYILGDSVRGSDAFLYKILGIN